jgi:hypothetical protein
MGPTATRREKNMIALREEYHAKPCLTPLFYIDEPEQTEALHGFRATFGKQTDIEPVSESVYALHIWPGHPGCPCDGQQRGQGW